ncbi:Fe-S cluster assembly protein dre2 [Calycina marina]|uniref:Fe-S cluster assembly protein dre2 n=1 Tax=Calycina marina TaxID=1763456 RepID=A0A9P7Z6D6_9HELO|nr:Fe-S cluster assembly protein dre2 [Calycina marina]
MVPSVDFADDFNPSILPAKDSKLNTRILLLAPPSIASHEEKLHIVLNSHNRENTDLQMLDRLSAGLVSLPNETYDLIIILTSNDGTRAESQPLLVREVFTRISQALKPGGKLKAQTGTFGQKANTNEYTESILAGLVADGDGVIKPDYSAQDAVPLRHLRRKDKPAAVSDAGPAVATTTIPTINGKRKSVDMSGGRSAGVGFVDFSDDFDNPIITGDDDLIDEDTLLTEEDLNRPVNIPPECAPRAGKRRRACKDCTCGLAEKIAAEDLKKRDDADKALSSLKLNSDDLAEVDFTVQGKVGSCGNCSLGDAFRCDGCPYIGMPAFKPGEEVRLLNNDAQF